jgi:asparagine synthase (glutamine-hydrolysing)
MRLNPENITSFLTYRHPIKDLDSWNYSYKMEYDRIDVGFEEAKDKTKDILLKSINNSLRNCNNPAVVMSGGLDSVLVAKLLKDSGVDPLVLTAKFKGDDDSKRAKIAAKKLNLNHTIIEILPQDYLDINKFLIPLIKLKKEPLHPNEIALAKIESFATKNGCDCIFSGEGADDIFGGYSKIFTYHKTMNSKEDFNSLLKRFIEYYRYFSNEDRNIINDKYLIDDITLLDFNSIDIINFGTYFIQRYHTPGLIKRGINAAKFNGLNSEFPYLDSKLVEYVNSLPLEFKVFGNISKYLLREISLDYIPKEISYGKKHPFPVPFDSWMKGINKLNLNRELFNSNILTSFNGWKKWMFINLNTWYEYGQ